MPIESADSEPLIRPTLESLAARHHSRIVRDISELNGMGANWKGLAMGMVEDVVAIPELLLRYVQRQLGDALSELNLFQFGELFLGENQPSNPSQVILIPGYAASPRHLERISNQLGDNVLTHPHFQKRKLKERVLDDGEILATNIRRDKGPANICAHSRGGLVTLCAMKILQDKGEDHRISKVFLLSPTSHGIRVEITPIARQLGINAIEDLCQGSEAVNFWQGLNAENRAKIFIISQEGGDGFTSPNHSFVAGSTMFVTPHCGHQKSVRDTSTPFFQLTVDLIEHCV